MVSDKNIIDYFSSLRERNCLGSAYLFLGENISLVKEIIKKVTCPEKNLDCDCWDCEMLDKEKHPDLLVIEPQVNNIKIESIREAQQFLSLKSFKLKKRVLWVKDGMALSLASANAFLKTLEEPPKNSFIAISAAKLDGLLPTIISRCRKIFLPFSPQALELDSSVSDFLSGQSIKFKDRQKFRSFLWSLANIFHAQIVCALSPENRLSKGKDYGIILPSYSLKELINILDKTLEVYKVYDTVNQNLALNLIRSKL